MAGCLPFARFYLRNEKADTDHPDAGRTRVLTRFKGNNAADDATGIPLKWQNGVFAPDRPSSDTVDRIEQRANERWLMQAAIRTVESGRAYSVANNQTNYLPNLLAQEEDRPKRFGERSIKGTFERLVRSDIITVRQVRDRQKDAESTAWLPSTGITWARIRRDELNSYLPRTHIKTASPNDLRGMALALCINYQNVTPSNFPQHTPPYPHAHSRPHLCVGGECGASLGLTARTHLVCG